MKEILIREAKIYFALLIFLALIIHPDLLSSPLDRLSVMNERGNYAHPLYYTFVIYMIVLFFRFIFSKIFSFLKSLKKDK